MGDVVVEKWPKPWKMAEMHGQCTKEQTVVHLMSVCAVSNEHPGSEDNQ